MISTRHNSRGERDGNGPVSVVIPARNAATTIGRTIRSLAADAPVIGEIILVENGSLDSTVAAGCMAAERSGIPLRVVRCPAQSAGRARNAGIDAARNDYIFLLDADDEIVPLAITRLRQALVSDPDARLAIGPYFFRAPGQADQLKRPGQYGADSIGNAVRCLAGEMTPVAMGSALYAREQGCEIRFPEGAEIDEDTCFWAALIAGSKVTTIQEPVLIYNVDEMRMALRYTARPRTTYLRVARALDGLARQKIPATAIAKRKSLIALRIARYLLTERRPGEALEFIRVPRAVRESRWRWRTIRYYLRASTAAFPRRPRGGRRGIGRFPSGRAESPILVVSAYQIYPPVSGADIRNAQIAMAASSARAVTVASVTAWSRDTGDLAPPFATARIARDTGRRGAALRHFRASIEPRITKATCERLLQLADELKPGIIILEGAILAALADALRSRTPRLVVDMHNVESALGKSMRALGLPGRSPKRDGARLFSLEKIAIRYADEIWVCSQQDASLLYELHHPAVPIRVIPNGIPTAPPATLARPCGSENGWPVLLFAGHLDYAPNIDAANRLARSILPALRKRFPDARAIIAGREANAAVRSLAGLEGVELHVDPPSMEPLLRRAHFAAVPLRAGGGTRIKILEAAAHGLVVVATPVAAEGLGLAPDADIAFAREDEEFAEVIAALCNDDERRETMRRNAHGSVERRFGTGPIAAAITAAIGRSEQP